MRNAIQSKKIFLKAITIGVGVSILVSIVMVPLTVSGVSPFPQPVAAAFVRTIFGSGTPLPVGLLFHVAYVTLWSVVFVALWRERPTFSRAAGLAVFLWIVAIVAVFPFVGWGFLGLKHGIGPMVFSIVPHALFAVCVWLGTKWTLTP